MVTTIFSGPAFYFISLSFGKLIASNSKKSFFTQLDGVFLNTNDKNSFEVEFLRKCSHICLRYENECKAINFNKKRRNNGRCICEILKTTSKDSPNELINDKQWIYIERILLGWQSDSVSDFSFPIVCTMGNRTCEKSPRYSKCPI